MTEAFLQYVWRQQLLSGNLNTTDGLPVSVVHPGEWNHDSGPDFVNARVIINGIDWSGNIEVHIKSSDWNAHQHTNDKAYNNVVLHVVYEHDCEVRTQSNEPLPELELKRFIPIELWGKYDKLMNPPSHNPIACGERLNEISGITRTMYLERLAIERLQRKSQAINQMLDDCKGGWETCCYWLFAHYFGGTANAFPFELMAKSTPMTILARYKGDKTRIEALLMGQSGLLEAYYEDDYPRMLQCEYETLRKGFSLSPISAHLWKFFRLRPSSFPTLRISQFASLISSSSNLFSKLLDTTDAKDLTAFFNVEATEYWKCHYQFDKPTKESAKKVGEMLSRTLIINAWVPLLFVYGSHHGMDLYKDRAIAILQQLPPEHNSIINHWKSHGIVPQSAAESQALIQLYNNYCNDHRCLDCQIGYKVLSK